MLREYIISEADARPGHSHHTQLGSRDDRRTRRFVPSLRPVAVLTRVAASHLRVGTFEYAACTRRKPAPASPGGIATLQLH